MDYHAYSPLRMFIHFITRHSSFPYFATPISPQPTPYPPLRFSPPSAVIPLSRASDVPTELPGTSRCCAARPRRRHLDDVRRRTVDEHTLEHGAYGAACSRRCRTRHDTRPQVAGGIDVHRDVCFAHAARAFLFLRTHRVSSFVLPSRSPSQSRLTHAAAHGDDHLSVVTCLAAAYVRADTPASWLFVSFSTSPPLGSATAHLPRSPPDSPNYAVCSPPLPIALCSVRWRLITAIGTRSAFPAPSPFSSYFPGFRQPTDSGSSSWSMRASDVAQLQQHSRSRTARIARAGRHGEARAPRHRPAPHPGPAVHRLIDNPPYVPVPTPRHLRVASACPRSLLLPPRTLRPVRPRCLAVCVPVHARRPSVWPDCDVRANARVWSLQRRAVARCG